jgi:hypothetical protein
MQDDELSFAVRRAFEPSNSPTTQDAFESSAPTRPPELTLQYLTHLTRSVFDQLDLQQLAITRTLSPAQRLQQVFEINRTLQKLIAAAVRSQQPGIDAAELQRRIAQRISGTYEL